MRSKNKPAQTSGERAHASRVAALNCIVCDAESPSQVHEPEQGMWWISMPLCQPCHTGDQGWHGRRLRWTSRKMNELKAINMTIAALYDTRRAA